MLNLITSVTYWMLTALWLAILWFYLDQLRSSKGSDKTVSFLLLILLIDAFRTVFESAYFGLFFNSLYGFLPGSVHALLSRPGILIVPKLLNLFAGFLVVALLIRSWLPRALRERNEWIHELQLAKETADLKTEEAQRQALKFEAVVNGISDAIIVTDAERRIVSVNKGTQTVFGYASDDLLGKTTALLYDSEETYEQQGNFCLNPSAKEASKLYEVNYRNAGGQLFVGETLGTPLFGVDGEVLGNIGVIRDVTLRKKAEEKLTLSASVFTHAREGIMITDASGIIVEVNDTFSLITGYSREEAAGIIPTNFRTDRHGANFYTSLWSALQEHGYWHGEVWHHRKTGEEYAALLTISAVHDESGAVGHYVALFTDITEIKEHQRQLEEIAHYDPLTGLPNRVLLADRLEQSIVQSRRRASPLAVAYLDLDDFKIVNDTHGHAVGDELLVELSRRMKNVLREGDTLARLGGDEFVAVLADMHTVDDCDPLLSRLLEAATSPVRLGDFSLRVSVSIGVTLFPQDHVDPDQLVRHADQAMYLAKQMGKNRYRIFDVVGDAKIKSRGEVLENNRNALRRNEFVMYYQPIVNMGSGEVIGVEALIRWQHPERGLLLPADFLPSVENHSTSIDIGDWVIDTVLAQIAEWRASGTNLRVSVNVGAGQLQRSDFVAKLANALARYPTVSSADLELEILETSALTNIETVTSIISECGNLGVSFALDDFGTGYSSLNYLKGFPADVLKIDQSFVIGMLDNQDDRSIVSAVIGLASAFQRQVVAEGVESVAHGAQLLRMGCEYAQGYVIARPMRAGDIPSWLRDWKPDASWTKIADAMGTAIDPPTDS